MLAQLERGQRRVGVERQHAEEPEAGGCHQAASPEMSLGEKQSEKHGDVEDEDAIEGLSPEDDPEHERNRETRRSQGPCEAGAERQPDGHHEQKQADRKLVRRRELDRLDSVHQVFGTHRKGRDAHDRLHHGIEHEQAQWGDDQR